MTEAYGVISMFSRFHQIQTIPFSYCNHYKKIELFTTSFSRSAKSFSDSTISISGDIAPPLKSLETEMAEPYLVISIFSSLHRIQAIPLSNCNHYKKIDLFTIHSQHPPSVSPVSHLAIVIQSEKYSEHDPQLQNKVPFFCHNDQKFNYHQKKFITIGTLVPESKFTLKF
jgi:hypothetical protein